MATRLHLQYFRLHLQYCKALYNTASHSPIHAHIDGGVSHAGRQPARNSQGEMPNPTTPRPSARRSLDPTSNLPVTSQPALPPEPQAALCQVKTVPEGLTWFDGFQRHRHVRQRDGALGVHRTGVGGETGGLGQQDGAWTGCGGHGTGSTGSAARGVIGLGLEVSQGEFGLALGFVPVKNINIIIRGSEFTQNVHSLRPTALLCTYCMLYVLVLRNSTCIIVLASCSILS